VARSRNDLEVVAEPMTLGERLVHRRALRHVLRLGLMYEKRCAEPLGGPVGRERGLVAMVQVLACDTAELGDGLGILLQLVGSVDEEVPSGAQQQEGPDYERGVEGQRRRLGRV